MANPTNARIILDPCELKTLEDLAEVNEAIKTLEAKKYTLVTEAKKVMAAHKVSSLELDDYTFTLSESQRRTVTKATRDEFIANLIGMGMKHLIVTSIEPDLDSIFAEVDAGNIDRDYVEKYVKVTPITTLRCT